MKVALIGAGAFGTSLAWVLGGKGYEVLLWAREPEVVEDIRERHENRRFSPGNLLPPTVSATGDLEEALTGADLVVSATPSHAARQVFASANGFIPAGVPIVAVSKGIEEETLLVPTEVLESVLPEKYHPYLAVLSGPSFAKEIVKGTPTVVTAAANWSRLAKKVQEAFTAPTFRCYTSSDVIGVQLGAALKNVMAIGSGAIDGMGYGHNARAALITRGLAEMTRISVAKGGNPLTLAGLAGLGDLVLTCTGDLSRNRTLGLELGRGKSLAEALASLPGIAEGVKTARSARDLARKLGVEAPITEQVYLALYEGKDPRQAVAELMMREPKPEY
jgi:glycerol-3-phosphate dehydrogenase (NAD(P)+)